jgi:hypothetical protein
MTSSLSSCARTERSTAALRLIAVEGTVGARRAKPAIYVAGVVRVGEVVAGSLDLSVVCARVTQCRSDHAFSLVLEEGDHGRHWVVRIEGPFSLRGSEHRTETFEAEAPASAWGPAIDALLNATLITAIAAADGALTLSFENGQRVEVSPQRQWEAWQVEGPDGVLVVCGPGGQLSRWPAQGAEASS